MLIIWHSTFAIPKHTNVISWLTSNSDEMIIYAFLLGFSSPSRKKQCVFVFIGTCVPWMGIETKFPKLCVSCSLDEHLYAQLSKWALWLVFVMSKIK